MYIVIFFMNNNNSIQVIQVLVRYTGKILVSTTYVSIL